MVTVDIQTVLILSVLFFSTFIRSTFGFGDALVAMPLLVVITNLKTATPLVAMVASTIAITILLRNWRNVHFGSTWRLIVSSLFGIPIGLFFLKGAHDGIMKLILAVVIILFSMYKLITPTLLRLRTERSSFVFGFLAGILGGAYNTNGPPVVVYGSLRQWSPISFRATLQGYFFLSGLLILLGHYSTGLWTRSVLHFYVVALPIVFLAIIVGNKLHRKIPSGKFDRYIHLLLLVIGTYLLVSTIQEIITTGNDTSMP